MLTAVGVEPIASTVATDSPGSVGREQINNLAGSGEMKSMSSSRVKVAPTIKLSSFDGSTLLESHIPKFENCSEYYQWDARECLCHLKSSLEGVASQVLWQLAKDATEADVIQFLRNRFGNQNLDLRQTRQFTGDKFDNVDEVYQPDPATLERLTAWWRRSRRMEGPR